MKENMKKLLALLLALCLLAALPAASAEESAQTPKEPTIQFMTEPKYAVTFYEFAGNYGTFYDLSTNSAGICDCFGNVRMSGKNINLEPFENGMAKEMGQNESGFSGWAVLSPTGKCLTPYTSGGEMACPVDQSTGKAYNWVDAEFAEDSQISRVDVNGNDPFAGKYDIMSGFIWDGKFSYCKDGKWGVDAVDGSHILPCEYEWLEMCDVDRCIFIENGKRGIIDLSGKVLLPAVYDSLWSTDTGTAYYAIQDGKWGIVTKSLKQTVPCAYASSGCLSENVCFAYDYDTKRLVIYDAEGMIKTDVTGAHKEYNALNRMFMYYVENDDGTRSYTVLNAAGEMIVEGKKAQLGVVADNLLLLENNGNTDVYDENGTLLNTIENAIPRYGQSRIPMVVRGDIYAVVGMDGKLSTDFVYSRGSFGAKDDMICLQRDGRWYLVSRGGKEYPEGGCDREVIFYGDSNYAGYIVNGYSGILRYVGVDDSLFADVANDAWYRTAADFCAERGIMSGTAEGQFSPNVTTTRSMIVSILYRLSGAEKPTGGNPFTDVKAGKWYTDAVLWAAENEIVSGYGNGKFGPDDPITREQIAVILKNYAEKSGADVSKTAALDAFPDEAKVGSWAKGAVSWAVAEGLISGSVSGGKTLLDPQGKATRAMIASIMMRFVQ